MIHTVKGFGIVYKTEIDAFLELSCFFDDPTDVSLLRNLYAGQEATVGTGHATYWFQIRKGVRQSCILAPCLFNLYAEYIMRNAGMDEAQAGIKIPRRNINSLKYADDTTLMAKSRGTKEFLMKVKEESEKAGLKLNTQKRRSWHPVPSLHGK